MTNKAPYDPTKKALGSEKLARIPIKIESSAPPLPKPDWIRIRLSTSKRVSELKSLIREQRLYTVCEEASCPNLNECYSHGTATFMIMGDKCTRRCSFCDVGHGRPDPLDLNEPQNLANTVKVMQLKYVVITSVDRDDLRDGGANHFSDCVLAVRKENPQIKIETLVPDFRGRLEKALVGLGRGLPDVFNHNIETVPRLYKQARPGSDFFWSLRLLKEFKQNFQGIPTKSGIMLGLGETFDEVKEVLQELRAHDVDMLTMGQYLQPTKHHMAVARYVTPAEFIELGEYAKSIGFSNVASGPLVRSSYHADLQAAGKLVS
jgi:lipoic acid synthetase